MNVLTNLEDKICTMNDIFFVLTNIPAKPET